MPCCGTSHVSGVVSTGRLASEFSITVSVEEDSLETIFSYFQSFNIGPVELKKTLFQPGTLKFISLEASLQKSNRPLVNNQVSIHEGRYLGQAIFQKQQQPVPVELRKVWLPLLLHLFPQGK